MNDLTLTIAYGVTLGIAIYKVGEVLINAAITIVSELWNSRGL